MSVVDDSHVRTLVQLVEGDAPNEYQSLLYDGPLPPSSVSDFDGRPKTAWSPPRVYSDQPRLKQPDIWTLIGSATLVFEPDTLDQLEPYVSIAGELLPVIKAQTEGTPERELLALNITLDIDCLDPERTILEPLNYSFAFLEHRLPESGLFKVPDCDTILIFHVERDDDDDSFRRRVAGGGFRGLSFLPVWDSVDGPVQVSLFRI